jgi:hypothetical protein
MMDSTCFAADGSIRNEEFRVQQLSSLPSNSYVYPGQIALIKCAKCKEKGHPLDRCRTREKHRALPWQTSYVTLTLARNANHSVVPIPTNAPESTGWAICQNGSVTAPHPSMTFLAIVSSKRNEAMVRNHLYCSFLEKSYF